MQQPKPPPLWSLGSLAGLVMLTHVITFELDVPYAQWQKAFADHAAKRDEHGLLTLFAGQSVEAENQVCVILQAEADVMERFMQAEAETIQAAGHRMETTQVKVYSA